MFELEGILVNFIDHQKQSLRVGSVKPERLFRASREVQVDVECTSDAEVQGNVVGWVLGPLFLDIFTQTLSRVALILFVSHAGLPGKV